MFPDIKFNDNVRCTDPEYLIAAVGEPGRVVDVLGSGQDGRTWIQVRWARSEGVYNTTTDRVRKV